MAYNILKGTVEFSKDTSGSIESMVNTWQAQTIDGNKVFVQTLSASAFRSDAGDIVPPAITAIASDGANRVLTSDGDNTATAQANVTIVNNALTASNFSGSGVGLTNLQSNQLIGTLSASQIHLGNGLEADGFNIRVDANQGIEVGASGVSADLMASSGIVFSGSNDELAIDPSNPPAITDGGQTLADADSFVVYDDSRTETRKAAAVDVYNYINGKISSAAITSYTNAADNRIITSVNSNTVNAEANLTFDGTDLLIAGNISGSGTAQIGGNLTGSNIVPNADEQYDLGQPELRYENAYFNFMNGGVAFDAVNDEGATISKGQVVYIKGLSGGTPTVALAACDDAAKMPAFGFVADGNIVNGSSGRIVTMGRLNGINTTAFSEGDILYVQTGSNGTSGSFTATRPTGSGNLLQNIGKVLESDASGQIRVGGAGRTNATPNLDKGYLFVGNDSDQSVQDNTIFISSSQNRVGINTTTPMGALDISGSTLITGSLEISGPSTTLLKLFKGASNSREIEIFSGGSRQSAITLNASEQLFIENESTKDIILRTNNQNTLRVFGQNQRVGIAKEGVSANAELDVDGAAIISGSFTVSGSSTIGLNASHVTQFDGPMSASAGMHISGTMPKLAIGSNTSTTNNSGMLTIRPDDTNNRVLLMCQRTEDSDNRIVLAATGSGQVIVGGAHLGGLFNITGSTAERLISLKAGADDGLDPAFYIDGTGDSYLSGSQTFKEPEPGIYLSSSVDDGAHAKIILNDSKNILVQNHSTNKNVVFKTNDGGTLKEGLRIGGAVPEVVVNEGSDSLLDFRVESNTNTHMIFSDGSANKVGINNSSPQLTFDVTGDVGVSNHIALNSSGTVDPTLYLNHAHIYSKLDSGTAEVYVRDSDGNVTKISPHTSEGEWEYFSRNTRTGKVVRVNMERMIRKLEEFTGESFMDEWYEEPTD